jgi:hypothetical protein
MEDLLPLGFKMVNRHDGLDLDHCLLAMKQLGKFHATSVLVRHQDPDCMDIFQQSFYAESINQEHSSKIFSGMCVCVCVSVTNDDKYFSTVI